MPMLAATFMSILRFLLAVKPAFSKRIIKWGSKNAKEGGVMGLLQHSHDKGMQKGALNNAREAVIEALEIHLEITVPAEIITAINQISDSAKLKEMLRKAIKSATLDEFTDYLQAE